MSRRPGLHETEPQHPFNRWNPSKPPYPDHTCIHDLFEAWATQRPTAPALVLGDATLSYGELNRRANRLARVLHDRGVGPDVPVAIFTLRSFDTLVGILGVLNARGDYL